LHVFSQERPQERVTVTAIEIPVRIIQKGKVVRELTRQDFEIYENGIKQEITAFEVISRKISAPIEKRDRRSLKRTFILIFNVFDYNDAVGEGIDYFFAQIFRPGDHILIITENTMLNIEKGKTMSAVIHGLKETLKRYKVISTGQILKAYKDLDNECDRLLASLRALRGGALGSNGPQGVLRFYQNYERIWKEYRRQFIAPEIGLYRSLIRRVKHLEGEKWVLCFQQREMFPKLRSMGSLDYEIRQVIETPSDDPVVTTMQRTIRSKQMELNKLFDVSSVIPAEALENLFMEANISFHLILFKSTRTMISEDFELGEVSQDHEDCFRQISHSTGGSTTFSNRISEAVQEASECEDYHYLLVYSPKGKPMDEERAIEVKLKNRRAEVIHLKRIPGATTPPISLFNFKARRKSLSFSLTNYKRVRVEGKITGYANVKVTVFDERSNKIFDEEKVLSLVKKDTHISLNISQMEPGSYFVIIQAVDRITNEIDVYSRYIKL
jgi:VWFA-related protein